MSTITLSNGAIIPSVGFGTWKIPKSVTAEIVYEAIKSGVRHIDAACDYGNEAETGLGIKRALLENICTREEIWVTSKLWNTFHNKEHVKLACQKSLSDFGLDYFDLYLIHFPISQKFVPFEVRYPPEWIYDPSAENPRIELCNVPISETWFAMEELVDLNLARNIGVCNLVVQSLTDLLSYSRIKPIVNQVEIHPYLIQQKLVTFCQAQGIQVVAFSPLGSSSYQELQMDQGLGVGSLNEPVVALIAESHAKSPAQIILRWHLQRGLSVIPKSTHIERIRENINIFDFQLTPKQVGCLLSVYNNSITHTNNVKSALNLCMVKMEAISSLDRNLRFNDPGEFCKGMGGSIPIYN